MNMAKKTYGKTRSGIEITDEVVERLAAKAETGYDVEEILRRRGGRPPLVDVGGQAPERSRGGVWSVGVGNAAMKGAGSILAPPAPLPSLAPGAMGKTAR